ncbi:hypothetical protein A2Z10_02900 [Candidatus Azambacteria bacterium RBG_16_47_10]|uniref:Uncharacterized protein n=1 Tax=Candidatus Azambacteria bacterium RBG_16_47_10 TaxID=1797292 RepID=A0A1F5B0R6_9BACT|nr:MAG: hypothetical protein A2Z10_02900 [Candidatus Azambacteria bacterium RBG_16_47_10]
MTHVLFSNTAHFTGGNMDTIMQIVSIALIIIGTGYIIGKKEALAKNGIDVSIPWSLVFSGSFILLILFQNGLTWPFMLVTDGAWGFLMFMDIIFASGTPPPQKEKRW